MLLRIQIEHKYYGELRSVFVAYLNTLNRLKISNPADLISRKAAKTHPIHYVAFEQKYRQWISANFKKAFGEELIPFTQNGNNIPLCIGKQVKFNDEEFSDEQTRQDSIITKFFRPMVKGRIACSI